MVTDIYERIASTFKAEDGSSTFTRNINKPPL
jgi:hypothetical protein